MLSRHFARTIVAAASLAGSPLALAAEAPVAARKPPAPEPMVSDEAEAETVVIVEKTSEMTGAARLPMPAREVAQTVNTVDARVLEQQGTVDFVGALQNVAGVNAMLTYGGFDFMVIRGFQDYVVLEDGIRDERHTVVTSAPVRGTVGLDRIEVLKGPSSLFHGLGALGGVVNLVSRRPQARWSSEFGTRVGSFDARGAHMGLTGPVHENLGSLLMFRLDVGADSTLGFRDAGTSQTSGVLTLEANPRAGHRLVLRGSWFRNRYDTDAGLPTIEGRVPTGAARDARYNSPYDRMRGEAASLRIEYQVDLGPQITLSERASFTRTDTEYLSTELLTLDQATPDLVTREALFFHHQVSPIANQLEVTARFRWGAEHTLTAGHDLTAFHWTTPSAVLPLEAIALQSPRESQDGIEVRPGRSRVRDQVTNGLFVADHMALSERWRVTLGARLDHWWRDTRVDTLDPTSAQVIERGAPQGRSALAPSYRAGIVFLPTAWAAPYTSVTTSFKPVAAMPADGRQLDPERGQQFELGARFEPVPDRLRVNTAIYQIDKSNLTVARPMMLFDQAGLARSRGAELDASWTTRRLTLRAGYAYTRARYVRYQDGSGLDLRGRRLAFVPDHIATLWGFVDLGAGFGVGGGGRYQSESFADPRNQVPMTDHLLVDGVAAYERGPVSVSLHAKNLFGRNPLDERGWYYTSAINDSQLTPGSPRTLLAQLRLRY